MTPQVSERADPASARPNKATGLSENLFFCLAETKVAHRDSGSDSEELTRGPDSGLAVSSQPPRVALFPGVDALALKVSL